MAFLIPVDRYIPRRTIDLHCIVFYICSTAFQLKHIWDVYVSPFSVTPEHIRIRLAMLSETYGAGVTENDISPLTWITDARVVKYTPLTPDYIS